MRYNWVSLQLISHFIQTKEYILAIPMMQKLLDRYPEDCALLSAAARLFIQIGIIPKAEELIERVKKLDTSSNVEIKTLIEMNRYIIIIKRNIFNIILIIIIVDV